MAYDKRSLPSTRLPQRHLDRGHHRPLRRRQRKHLLLRQRLPLLRHRNSHLALPLRRNPLQQNHHPRLHRHLHQTRLPHKRHPLLRQLRRLQRPRPLLRLVRPALVPNPDALLLRCVPRGIQPADGYAGRDPEYRAGVERLLAVVFWTG